MNRLGIFTTLDLRAKDEAFLRMHFGKAGPHYFNICRGVDHRPVCANRVRKSVGAENTFPRDLSSFDEMKAELEPLVDKVWRYCESTGVRGRTVTLKVKFADFQVITRSHSKLARSILRHILRVDTSTIGNVIHMPCSTAMPRVSLTPGRNADTCAASLAAARSSAVLNAAPIPRAGATARGTTRSVSGVQPILLAIDMIVAHCEPCSVW